jgi:glycogen operon protein
MNHANLRLLPALLVLLLSGASCGESDDGRVRLYHTEPLGPGLEQVDVEALDHLGPSILETGVNFGVFSANATRVDVLLFDDPESNLPTRQFEMERFGDVWNLYVEGIGRGQHYGYVAWGPNWEEHEDFIPGTIHGFLADVDADGHRFNPNKLLIDPYAKVLHRDHDWLQASLASGPARTLSTYGAGAKSIVWSTEHEWGPEEDAWRENRQNADWEGHRWSDLILYEVHPKGFTASPASGVEHPGTFRGFGENADYLQDLGINAVELLPIHEKPLDGGYWGYNNLSFFAPEISFSSAARAIDAVDEFKTMVEELHKRDIEVIIDVVYNQTGEGGLWREKLEMVDTLLDPSSYGDLVNFDPKEVAGLYSFRGLDNQSYYALNEGNQTYWNNTGVGNQTRPHSKPMRKLIMDSLRFMVEELHVDGFRFDLAPVLGASDIDPNKWGEIQDSVLQEILDDPILSKHNVRIIAEPWAAGGDYGWSMGAFPAATEGNGKSGWYEWNAYFRDWWRNFINSDDWRLSSNGGGGDGGSTLTGSYDLFSWNGRRPYHSVNFITVHDGFTMYDLVSYENKQNGCGPLNPVCCEDLTSPFCDRDSGDNNNHSRNWGEESVKRQQMRNLFVGLMISQGTPLILGGDEWMRTQLGNNNAYSTKADNEANWYDWGGWKPNASRNRMKDFVSNMTRFRHSHRYAFAPTQYGESAPYVWRNAANNGDPDWNSRNLMQHYNDSSAGDEIVILMNMESGPVEFTMPPGRDWKRVVDTSDFFDTEAYLEGIGRDITSTGNFDTDGPSLESTYFVNPRSIVIAVAGSGQ